ncbi:acetyl-CoA carboxylase biotin carboxyl carrier protein [bacterium]|nr:acetyl-CoA carboxylase biotin carboxyl carrier protein [bacterium]
MYNKDNVKELINLLNENNLTEISVKNGDKEIVIKKESCVMSAPAAPLTAVSAVSADQPRPKTDTRRKITSPMVGTFYSSSSPTASPYVEIGDVVAEGQVVCIIEAMKLMNEIESDISGKIVEICVQNGEAVEFGQTLMYVE